MNADSRIHLAEVPVAGNAGSIWNRLHSEREDICEAMLKESRPGLAAQNAETMTQPNDVNANWHRGLLQSRLRKIDDALDRLMSGSYGNCAKCGRWIEDTKLDFDPAIAFCIECWQRQQRQLREEASPNDSSVDGVRLASLAQFDTVKVQTRNSTYRIFILDPDTGRALVEGGHYFADPVEALMFGSTLPDNTPRVGWIGVGSRIEMWVNGNIVSTSPVQSLSVDTTHLPAAQVQLNYLGGRPSLAS